MLPALGIAIAMGVIVLLVGQLPFNTVVVMIIQICTGCVFYFGVAYVMRIEAIVDVLSIRDNITT